MTFERLTHKAWITITDLPLQAWNRDSIRKSLTEYGSSVHFELFGVEAGHFEDVRLKMVGANPMGIPRRLNTENKTPTSSSTSLSITIEGYNRAPSHQISTKTMVSHRTHKMNQ
jgi:hypothetical protein